MFVILETLSILDLTLFGVKGLIELYSVHSILNRRMDAVQLIQRTNFLILNFIVPTLFIKFELGSVSRVKGLISE